MYNLCDDKNNILKESDVNYLLNNSQTQEIIGCNSDTTSLRWHGIMLQSDHTILTARSLSACFRINTLFRNLNP